MCGCVCVFVCVCTCVCVCLAMLATKRAKYVLQGKHHMHRKYLGEKQH
jgi:hypothetical protein